MPIQGGSHWKGAQCDNHEKGRPLKAMIIAGTLLATLILTGCGSASSSTNSSRTSSGLAAAKHTASNHSGSSGGGVKIVGCWMNPDGNAEVDVTFPAGTPAKGSDVSGAVYVEVGFLGPGDLTGPNDVPEIAGGTVYAGSVPGGEGQVLGVAESVPAISDLKLQGKSTEITGCQIEEEYKNEDPSSNAPTLISKAQGPAVAYGTTPPAPFE